MKRAKINDLEFSRWPQGAPRVELRTMSRWDELDASDGDVAGGSFQCPYCWQFVEPPLEDDLHGEMVWDCEVCCRPWLIRIRQDHDGTRQVSVERAQD
jgi:hypothetical protein